MYLFAIFVNKIFSVYNIRKVYFVISTLENQTYRSLPFFSLNQLLQLLTLIYSLFSWRSTCFFVRILTWSRITQVSCNLQSLLAKYCLNVLILPNSFIKTNINKLLANLIANKFSDTCYNIRLVCSYEAHLEING